MGISKQLLCIIIAQGAAQLLPLKLEVKTIGQAQQHQHKANPEGLVSDQKATWPLGRSRYTRKTKTRKEFYLDIFCNIYQSVSMDVVAIREIKTRSNQELNINSKI